MIIKKLKKTAQMKKAEQALKIAAERVIKEHRKKKVPLIIWRDGKVVKVMAKDL